MTGLRLVPAGNRDRVVETALDALRDVMACKSIPYPVRRQCAAAHTELHACRSAAMVAAMEKEQRLRDA